MSIFDLESNFIFYASYHHDKWNKLIHILCVWPILWTGLVFSEYVPYEWKTAPAILTSFHPANLSFALVLIYASFYIIFDQKAGTFAAFVLFLCLVTSRKFFLTAESNYGYPAWAIALAIHIAGWVAEFFGHGHFEGRSPALLDNLLQAFLMAPFFVLLEVLFMFGYRKDFHQKVERIVMKNVAQFKQQQKKQAAGGGSGSGAGGSKKKK